MILNSNGDLPLNINKMQNMPNMSNNLMNINNFNMNNMNQINNNNIMNNNIMMINNNLINDQTGLQNNNDFGSNFKEYVSVGNPENNNFNIMNNNIQNNINLNEEQCINNNNNDDINDYSPKKDGDTWVKVNQYIKDSIKETSQISGVLYRGEDFTEEQINNIKEICSSYFNFSKLEDSKNGYKIAQRLKQKYEGEWFFLVCPEINNKTMQDFDFKFTNIERKNMLIFSENNFRFYICRL